MQIVKKKVTLKNYGEKHKINIGLFGDIHWDDIAFSKIAWNEGLKRWKKYPDQSGLICVGDVLSFSNTNTRKKLLAAFDDSTQGEEARDILGNYVKMVSGDFVKSIRPVEDMLWGFVQGNHSWEFPDGSTIDERISDILKTDYADGVMILILLLSVEKRETVNQFNIVIHHGYGRSSASTPGGSINNRSKKNAFFANANIIATGHDHTLSVTPERPRLFISPTGNINELHSWSCATGSFVNSYRAGKAGYVEKAFMPPTSLGFVEFDIWLERENTTKRDRQIVKSQGKVIQLNPEPIIPA